MSKKKNHLQLTTRGRYAVIAMIELAKHENGKPVPLSEIAHSGDISLSYMEQLFSGLRKNKLVRSYRGPGGGYILAKTTQDIKISDILRSAEDSVPGKKASNANNRQNKYATALWASMGDILEACMDRVTLEDVVNQNLSEHPAINSILTKLEQKA